MISYKKCCDGQGNHVPPTTFGGQQFVTPAIFISLNLWRVIYCNHFGNENSTRPQSAMSISLLPSGVSNIFVLHIQISVLSLDVIKHTLRRNRFMNRALFEYCDKVSSQGKREILAVEIFRFVYYHVRETSST